MKKTRISKGGGTGKRRVVEIEIAARIEIERRKEEGSVKKGIR